MRPRPTKRPCTAEETTDDTKGQPTNRRGDGVCKGCSGKEPTSKKCKTLTLDTTGRQGDVNQNHSELLPTPVGTAVIHKTADTVTTRSKGTPCSARGSVRRCSRGHGMAVPRKIRAELPHNPAVAPLRLCEECENPDSKPHAARR